MTLVDIDPTQPQGLRAWRTASKLFGVEFARVADIRRINFGPDGSSGRDFHVAGETVQTPGFDTCPMCGAVQNAHPQAYDTEARRVGTRHAGWCPQRRKGVSKEKTIKVFTGHELRTQALRLLLPFSTTLVEQRLVSFQAALMLGITKHFGGEPDHIEAVMASMPGDDEDVPRRFLVLHDTMPGGTGYLEHLANELVMERVLRLALNHITSCECGKEDRQPCHRCLLPFVRSAREHELVSKKIADELLTDILDGWQTCKIDTLSDIRMHELADSELERLFIETLRTKARQSRQAVRQGLSSGAAALHDQLTMVARAGSHGVQFDVTAKPVAGPSVKWLMRDHVLQRSAASSEPDYVYTCDQPPAKIAVFLDGFAFHASGDNNRIASDAAKRMALRDEGTWVWQLTWDDVKAWAKSTTEGLGEAAAAPTLLTQVGLQKARDYHYNTYQATDPDAGRLDPALLNPVEALLAFMTDPDPEKWAKRAVALLAGAMGMGKAAPVDRESAVGTLMGLVTGAAQMPGPGARDAVGLQSATPSGCRIVALRDNRPAASGNPDPMAWTAFACLDDSPDAISQTGHRARWAEWLAWSNLLQFLHGPGRHFEQAASSSVPLLNLHRVPLFDDAAEPIEPAPELTADWADAVELASPLVESLVLAFAARRGRLPAVGFELGTEAWPAELAWQAPGGGAGVAVVLGADSDRDNAYSAAGWHVYHADIDDMPDVELIRRVEALHG